MLRSFKWNSFVLQREIIILELAFYNIKRSYFRDAVDILER